MRHYWLDLLLLALWFYLGLETPGQWPFVAGIVVGIFLARLGFTWLKRHGEL